jgi:hypothetical protein
MATASEYAQWIINNQNKKGTPEFETVSKAYQAAKQQESSSGFSVKETIGNIPGSALEYGKNIVGAVLSPVQTVKGALDIGSGAMLNTIPGYEKFLLGVGADTPEELNRVKNIASGVGQYYKERFSNPLQTIQRDPVGALGDVSALLTGGATILPKIGAGAAKVGAAIEPLSVASNVAGYGVSKALPTTVPAKLYESAVKWPPGQVDITERARLTDTALREQLMPTYAGVGKTQSKISELGNTIDMLIDNATNTGVKIPSEAVFAYINDAKSKLGGPKIEAAKDLAEINKIEREFKSYLSKNKIKSFTPKQLDDFKSDVYKRVDYGRAPEKPSVAKEEVYKGMGRAAKETLQSEIPEIGGLNRQIGDLINLSPYLTRAASRIENRDLVGLSDAAKIGAGGIAGDVGGLAVGAGTSILDFPKTKAAAGLSLSKKQRQGLGMFYDNSPRAALLRQLLQQSGAYQQQGLLEEE